MSENLTPDQILQYLNGDLELNDWHWEEAADNAINGSERRDAEDAARFLEKLQPGRSWSVDEYNGLMHHHFTGRWTSAAEIGAIRAHEKYEDLKERYAGDPSQLDRIEAQLARRTASDEAAEQYLRTNVGTYVFDCADGTVLTFDRIFNGTIDEEPIE
jgi:hypothetical protein